MTKNIYENYIAFATIVRREVQRFMRIWSQTLLPPAITMSLYFIIFGHFVGHRIGKMGGYHYMQYIAPGLIMMSVLTNAYMNVTSSFFGSKYQRNIEELMVAPVPPWIILTGYIIGGVLRGLITGIIVTIIALSFTHLKLQHPVITIFVIMNAALLFAIAGFINGLFAKKFDDVSFVPTFIITPLTYLGGVFYSITLLSPMWYRFSLVNPILYMVNAFRYGILGVSDVHLGFAVMVMMTFTVGLFTTALILLRKGIGLRA